MVGRTSELASLAVVVHITQAIVVTPLQENVTNGRRKLHTQSCSDAVVEPVVGVFAILVNHTIGTIGGLGLVGGTLMGSPILGAIAGSTIGFVAKSSKAQDFLFGNVDEEGNRTGGVIPKEMQDLISKNAPALAGGAIAGMELN